MKDNIEGKFKPYYIKDLIEELQKLPEDTLVLTEGCDCIGPACGISFNKEVYEVYDHNYAVTKYSPTVTINRTEGM